jgi:hypothetical protein
VDDDGCEGTSGSRSSEENAETFRQSGEIAVFQMPDSQADRVAIYVADNRQGAEQRLDYGFNRSHFGLSANRVDCAYL